MSSLSSGARLGQYEVIAPLGSGGMGEVYRARDTRLGRDVALKILPELFTKDAERVARFQREAQLLASLNHPHIGAIYGLEESHPSTGSGQAAAQFLVLELIDGETLAQRIEGQRAKDKGQGLTIAESLDIARQIADALDAAHEKGIVHRDLKPANIAVTHDGQVKILDFGLAKSVGEGSRSGAQGDLSPTLTFAATQAGVILGTAAYMSPEQAKGRPTDKRTDVWAFGCVLFEMLTGTRAFEGDDVTEIIASVVKSEPDWTKLPAEVPAQIQTLIRRCLDKERKTRVSDIGVAKFLMTETIPPGAAHLSAGTLAKAEAGHHESGRAHDGRKHLALGAFLGLVAGALVALALLRVLPATKAEPQLSRTVRFAMALPAGQRLDIVGTNNHVAISPDGGHIVYTIKPSGPASINQSQLVVRSADELEGRILEGAIGTEPFFSPDGKWIGYFALGQFRKVATSGGPSIAICTTPANTTLGASWGDDDTIVFAVPDARGGLSSITASNCEPKPLTTADPMQAQAFHGFPVVLPGSRYVLYSIAGGSLSENAQIAVLDRTTGKSKVVLQGGSDGKYLDGYLIYGASGGLRAVRFDLAKLETVGNPVPVVEQVFGERTTGEPNFAVSSQGTLVFIPGGTTEPAQPQRTLTWVNRQGREEPIEAPARIYGIPRLSPDGTRVALDLRDQTNDIWILDLARETLTPLSRDPSADMSPVWTPDGRRVIWMSTRHGNPSLYWQAADGTGAPERITESVPALFPTSITPDGAKVAVHSQAGAGMDISLVSLDSSAKGLHPLEPLLRSGAMKLNPEISPDGHWIAYQSNESGRPEIYVRPFPNLESGRYQISGEGGSRPAWSRSGKELFYLNANDLMTTVPVQATATSFSPGKPVQLLKTRYYPGASTRGYDLRGYDASADGQRFLMIKENAPSQPSSDAPSPAVVVVLNWLEELKLRAR